MVQTLKIHFGTVTNLYFEDPIEKMVITNPYLKKKQVPKPSKGSAEGPRSSSMKKTSRNCDNNARRHPASTFANSGFAYTKNPSQLHPSRVTPIGKERSTTSVTQKKVASKPCVSLSSSMKQSRRIVDNGLSIHTATSVRPLHDKSNSATISSKSKTSVKRRLKQEIAALKKQKQLQKLQKQAEERKRLRLVEKRAEENRRIAHQVAKEEERRKKQAERERSAAMKKEELPQPQSSMLLYFF